MTFPHTSKVFQETLRKTGGGASLVVYHRGRVALSLHDGQDAQHRPWTGRTLTQCQSTTKGLMATALHLLASRGLLDVAAPVAEYWPEFAANGKHDVLVRHVLSHSAGLHKMRARTSNLDQVFDFEHQVRALEEQSLAYEPGSKHGYHALTYGWLTGELLRRISGLDINTFIANELAEPLNAPDLHLGCPPEKRSRVAPCRFRYSPVYSSSLPAKSGQLTADPRCMDIPVPAIGGFFTADAIATVYAMLATGGSWQGRQYLTPETLTRATTIQSSSRDIVFQRPMMWRLGYHGMRARKTGFVPGAFGHLGFGGSAAWADPQHELAAAYTCDRSTQLADQRVPRIIQALHQDLRR